MQGIQRKIVYVGLYELLANVCLIAGFVLFSSHGLGHASIASVVVSAMAVAWNLAYNTAFEAWESRQARRGRGWLRRVGHAVGFEAGLIVLVVPFFAWWFQIPLWEALMLDLGLVLFFLGYTFLFGWAFDQVFGLPASAMA